MKILWTFGAVFLLILTEAVAPACSSELDGSMEELIRRAGNADDDLDRLTLLRQLGEHSRLKGPLREDLEKLIAGIDRYVHEKQLPYFGGQVSRRRDYDFGISAESPLHPLTYLYRGRMVTWVTLESGGIWNVPERRRLFLNIARGFFEKAREAYPENRIIRMYLGEPIPPSKQYHPAPGAPEWAVFQRESLERLADIIQWWIEHRMQDSGEYGGGWGDDCEMWRWWVPVLIGFDAPEISRAQERFSEAILSQPHMRPGYTTRMTDVEHTAEDSADAMTPMMHLDPENDVWKRRALRLAELMEALWTGRNERGLLMFKSTYFTAERVDTDSQRACDTVYHPRAVQPTLLYWQRTSHEKLTRLFSAWMDTWVDAAARSERGKPAGIIPTAIHWPDGRLGGLGPDWWDPRNHGETTLYLYPSAMDLMLHTLLLTHHMTGKETYLEPIRSLSRIRWKYLETPPPGPLEAGSESWCAGKIRLSSVLAKYRFLTGSTEFDALLAREMSPYMRFRLEGRREPLDQALRSTAEALRINFPGFTGEVRYTDRVLRFPTLFEAGVMFQEAIPEIKRPDPSLLYSTVTGDPGGAGYFPLGAVRWLTPPREIAALVTGSGRDRFTAELFHFGEQKRPMKAELYLLKPGKYRMKLFSGAGKELEPTASREFSMEGSRCRISFELPPRKLCTLAVRGVLP